MVSFRNWSFALTGLALFTGLASAQVGDGQTQNPLSCQATATVTPQLRAEGFTEQVGDITITCTGGNFLTPGSLVPQVNVQVSFGTQVTSRLFGTSPNVSEALLLIDEPGSGLSAPISGFGPDAAQTVCGSSGTYTSIGYVSAGNQPNNFTKPAGTASAGCVALVGNQPGNSYRQAVRDCTDTNGTACTATSTTPAANIYQGIVEGSRVTFFGIPVLPPVTAGYSRVYRITNIRVNANALASAGGVAPVNASVAISGATSLLTNQPNLTVGFVQQGLSTGTSTATSLKQCNTETKTAINTLSFTEGFGTAFKTRVAAASNSLYAGQINDPVQNKPNTIYNSESNLVIGVPTGTNSKAGLADYGTRLKASFTVPTGFNGTLWVSTSNVGNNATTAGTVPTTIGGSLANGAAGPAYAQLVSSETVNDGNAGTVGFFPAVSSTDNSNSGNVPIVQLAVVNGQATAVWEVVNTNPNALETLRFGVYVSYTANPAQNNPPAPGSIGVNLSFAPTTTATPAASTSLSIPRFAPDAGSAKTLANFTICRTVLLYPYVVNVAGFDTGLAIANTSTDPLGTSPQNGTCSLKWYQGASNPADTTTPTIASGTVYAALTSTLAPGFGGYMIAVCNFQLAHGFAFVSDLGARDIAMGYLALVLPDGSRTAANESLSH